MATVTVVMPTRGRPTLTRAISSVVDQLEDGDELIVVGDSAVLDDSGVAAEQVEDFLPGPLFYVECERPGSCFGNAQRDLGMNLALGRSSHLMFLDDDDVYRHGALDVVRPRLDEDPMAAHIFKAEWGAGHHAHGTVLWQTEEVREGNVGTPMVVLPNRMFDASWWQFNGRGVVSDFGFLGNAIRECAGVRWHPELIATVRP